MKLMQHRPRLLMQAVVVLPWLLITAPTPLPAGVAESLSPPMSKSKPALKCCACHLLLARRWHPPARGGPRCSGKSREVKVDHQLNAGWDVTCKPQDGPCWSELNTSCFCCLCWWCKWKHGSHRCLKKLQKLNISILFLQAPVPALGQQFLLPEPEGRVLIRAWVPCSCQVCTGQCSTALSHQLSHAGISFRNLLAIDGNKSIIMFPSTVKNKTEESAVVSSSNLARHLWLGQSDSFVTSGQLLSPVVLEGWQPLGISFSCRISKHICFPVWLWINILFFASSNWEHARNEISFLRKEGKCVFNVWCKVQAPI